MAGFDTLVSKIMSFVIGVGLAAPLALVRNKLYVLSAPFPPTFLTLASIPLPPSLLSARLSALRNPHTTRPLAPYTMAYRTILLTVVYEGLLIGFWFIDHA